MFGRSFSKHERKRMGRGALICCFITTFTLCSVFKPFFGPLPLLTIVLDFERSVASALKQEISPPHESYTYVEEESVIQNFSNSRSQVYQVYGDIRIHGNSSTIFIPTAATQQLNDTSSWTIKPYARYFDRFAMGKVTTLKVINQNPNVYTTPHCTRSFKAPAVVFSVGGYTGNLFHDFTDVLVPLYLTCQQFNTTVVFLIVSDKNSWWTTKYRLILNRLSKYDVVDIGNVNEVLCFPRMIVGLKSHKELGIDQSISPNYSMTNFTKFLRKTYSLNRGFIDGNCKKKSSRHPRLLIISRKKTRHLRNEHDVSKLAQSVGFNVTVREMGWQVSTASKFVNRFDVMVAVHGAGITNMVYLPENAVVIEIVPLGLEILSKNFFGIPSKEMNLRYLEYKVSVNESSLIEKYPKGLHKKGWHVFRSVYLDNQDVSVDLIRFRKTLLEAMELVCS